MMHSLVVHLWQSTFFALAAGLLTVVFRSNRAQVRYSLWLIASLKFLVPFALLVDLGSALETWLPAARQVASQITIPNVSWTGGEFSGPMLSATSPTAAAPVDPFDWLPLGILAVWLAGFAMVAFVRFRNWIRIRGAVRASTATGVSDETEIRVSAGHMEPGVVGIVRPVVLLPRGLTERLTPSELEAVLAHELSHVRRHDNFFAAVHMLVEGIFWFHPLVWWLGARLVEERERACDEEVLSRGSHPEIYADAILNVCKLYVQSPLVCASGVSGGSVRRRIEAILSNRQLQSLNRAKKLLLALAGAGALAGPITLGLLLEAGSVSDLDAQPSGRKFEVTSIHRCGPNTIPPLREGGGLGDIGASPNRVHRNCVTTLSLLQTAYVMFADGQNRLFSSVQMPPVEKAPAWMANDLYSIEAKAEGAPGQPMMLGPMMQALLEDRFHLKLHRETRNGPAFELTVAKGGSKMKLNDGSCAIDVPPAAVPKDPATGRPMAGFASGRVTPPSEPGVPCRFMLNLKNGPNALFAASAMTLDAFCSHLSRVTGRTVINRTGLDGKYNVRLEYFPDDVTPGTGAGHSGDPADIQTGATLFTALEQQLGLKLTSVKGTREVIVIDHVEKPTTN